LKLYNIFCNWNGNLVVLHISMYSQSHSIVLIQVNEAVDTRILKLNLRLYCTNTWKPSHQHTLCNLAPCVPDDCIHAYVPWTFPFVIFLFVWLLNNGSLWTEKCWSWYNIDHWGIFLYTVLFIGWFIKGEMRTVFKVSKFQYPFVLTTT